MRVSACYIVKNAASDLARSINSLLGQVDEVVVVDTGSSDATVKVAESLGARVFDFEWQENFAAARNFALSKVTGDWLILLDADEYFTDKTAANLRSVLKEATGNGLLIQIVNYDVDKNEVQDYFFQLRAVKNQSGLAYQGIIHEELKLNGASISQIQTVSPELLEIYHTGYKTSTSRQKSQRNLQLLHKAVAKGKSEAELSRYFCECYAGLGDMDKAVHYAWLYVNEGRHSVTYASNCNKVLLGYYADKKDADSMKLRLAAASISVEQFPELPDFWAEYGECLYQHACYEEAWQAISKAIELLQDYHGMEPSMLNEDKDNMLTVLQERQKIFCLKLKEAPLAAELEKLHSLMSAGKLSEADVLCQKLSYKAAIQDACLDMQHELAEIAAVIVIESDQQEKIESARALLSKYPQSAYTSFLTARLYWQAKEHFKAMLSLEDKFAYVWQSGQVHFAEDSIFYQANGDVQEVICNLFAQCYKFFGVAEKAMAFYLLGSKAAQNKRVKISDYSNYLFSQHYLFLPPSEYYEAHVGYNELYADIYRYTHNIAEVKQRYGQRKKLRIGYISPDFRHHVVLLFIWVMLTRYNAEEFEVFLFSNSEKEDKYSEYLQKRVQGWFNISSLNAQQAAQLVKEQEIDILVELAGHSRSNCLPVLAYKPAPVQICGIGYFATTGLKTVDYFLTDRYLVNAESEKYFTEKLLVLPHSHFCYTALKENSAVQGAPCKRNGYITFGSFNNLTKVNDTVLKAWAELLHAVQDSRLLLKSELLDDAALQELTTARLLALGIGKERFELRGFSSDYLPEYHEMDIALDTFPYPGGGTTCDALYMGVPVVSLGDGSHGGNFGISLLKNIGLDFACAENIEEYIEKAKTLAGDYELLDALHLGLRRMMEASPLMDEELYMQDLESGYKKVWKAYIDK